MPQARGLVTFSPTSKPGSPHIRHHHHKYCWDRSDYVDYRQVQEKMRRGHGVPYDARGAPWALDDDVPGVHRYQAKEYAPAPWYRHRTWWREPGIRPWEHDDLLHHSRATRAPGLNPWIVSSSANAPFATFHNEALQKPTDVVVVPPWEKDEHQHMKSCGYCRGHVDAGSELLTKVHKQGYESLNWELDYDHHKHHKESRTFDLKYPDNKWNEIPWNRKPGETKFRPMSSPPPKPPVIRESCAFAAPFATRDNMVVLKPQPFVETHWPFERHEHDPHGKLPRRFLSFPRDPKTYEWHSFPHAEELKSKDQGHCGLKEGHVIKHSFYPGDPTKKNAAGDFGRVVYPPKVISYPRDPATYNPFPVPWAYEPEDKNQGHCDMKQGHDRGYQFYPGDPSKMPAAGQKVPPKVYPPTWDVNAPYMYESYVPHL